jgi:AcrR family transcriptional regulator
MSDTERRRRADALRNRQRLLEAAADAFCERGLDVGVGEIAQRAGVGRGTLFRNFPTKQDLIAAIVVERMRDAVTAGRELLAADDDGEALFDFIADMVGRQQIDRALFEAVADEFLANAEIRAAHAEVIAVLDALLERSKDAGIVRPEIGAMDVLMMVKGVCAAAAALGEVSPAILERHLDLVRAAITMPGHAVPLRGTAPTLDDLNRAFPQPSAPAAKPAA